MTCERADFGRCGRVTAAVPAPGGPLVRPAGEEDLTAMREIYNHYVATSTVTFDDEPIGASAWRAKVDEVAAVGLPWIVAMSDPGRVVGYAHLTPWKTKPAYRHTAENSVYVHPDSTGRGIGRALLAGLLDRAATAGLRQVIAVVADQGADASLALHRRLGFTEKGRLEDVGRKFDRWIGTILLQKSLVDRPPEVHSGGGSRG